MFKNSQEDIEGALPDFTPVIEPETIDDIHLVHDQSKNSTVAFVLQKSGEVLSFVIDNNVVAAVESEIRQVNDSPIPDTSNASQSTLMNILANATYHNQSILVTIIVSALLLIIVCFLLILLIGSFA